MNSTLGNKIQHFNAYKTEQLNPPHKYVPWITLNDEHTEEIEQNALDDLVKLICETYSGSDKPSICFNYK
jgi:interferon gamma-inducible protein 30